MQKQDKIFFSNASVTFMSIPKRQAIGEEITQDFCALSIHVECRQYLIISSMNFKKGKPCMGRSTFSPLRPCDPVGWMPEEFRPLLLLSSFAPSLKMMCPDWAWVGFPIQPWASQQDHSFTFLVQREEVTNCFFRRQKFDNCFLH